MFDSKLAENSVIIKLMINMSKKSPVVLKIFLLKRSFREIKNAIKGFLFLKNNAGTYRNIK